METKVFIEIFERGEPLRLDKVYNALGSLSPGRYEVKISKYKKRRSLSQQGYYFKVVVPAVRDGLIDMGFSPDKLDHEATHELLKAKFLKEDIPNEQGEFVTIIKSTTTLSTYEYTQFLEQIWQWAIEFLGIHIASPGEQSEMF